MSHYCLNHLPVLDIGLDHTVDVVSCEGDLARVKKTTRLSDTPLSTRPRCRSEVGGGHVKFNRAAGSHWARALKRLITTVVGWITLLLVPRFGTVIQ